ncbi:MAG: NAD-dependent 4,6-dehydratase LegB [Xanthobacteraceae bacterium]
MSDRTLVTGADGFIGSHLAEALVRRGKDVRAFVLYNSLGSWGWLDEAPDDVKRSIEVVAGDVRDAAVVKEAMRGCDTVLNLAALIAIPYSYRAPESYVDTNIKGVLNVIQAARELGTAKVVHTSTSEVYGTARSVPITEDHPLQGQSPYSATKIAADQLALSFHRSFGMPVAIVRPFNTYGPRQSARAVLPTIITQLAAGSRVSLGALHPTRDFSFVADTVEGIIAVAESAASIGEVINLGSGFEISIGEAARLIATLMGKSLELVDDSSRYRPEASEVERLLADTTKAQRLLGWRPQFAGLDGLRNGLAQTIEWFRDPANLRRYRTDAYVI